MKSALWLRQIRRARQEEATAIPALDNKTLPAGEQQSLIFIQLPRKRRPGTTSPAPVLSRSPHIAVLLPPERMLRGRHRRAGSSYTTLLVSVASLTATVFAAIGVLQLMIAGFGWQKSPESAWRPGLAAHKPGPGPARQDAVTNEYQHALTREMIAAADTSRFAAGKQSKELPPAILPHLTVTANQFSTAVKGQINDLKVRIFNGSKAKLEKVTVQVDFLSETGHLLRTESYTTDTLAPLQLKVIDVPQGMPGTQVRCYIQELRTKAFRTSLRGV